MLSCTLPSLKPPISLDNKKEDSRSISFSGQPEVLVLTKIVDLAQTIADRMLPNIVANSTRFRPYLSDTAQVLDDAVIPSAQRLTAPKPGTDETLTQAEQTPHRSSKEDHIPVLISALCASCPHPPRLIPCFRPFRGRGARQRE